MKRHVISALFAVCLLLNCFSAVQAVGCEKEQTKKASLPPNLILPSHLQSLFEKVWRSSPTFRHQCERIAQAQWLRIRLKLAPKPWVSLKYRALTIVNKQVGLATIEIYALSDYVELFGHEFEHLVEQIEGINLATLSAEKGSQAYRQEGGIFETRRAVEAGRKVKAEFHRAKRSGNLAVAPCSALTVANVASPQPLLTK